MELLQRSLFRKSRCTKGRRITTKYLVIGTGKKLPLKHWMAAFAILRQVQYALQIGHS